MKEFEKWFNELDDVQHTRFTKQNRSVAAISWEAALEWIYKEAKKLCKNPDMPVTAFDLIETAFDLIEDELNDQT
jgi:hypothetical protein